MNFNTKPFNSYLTTDNKLTLEVGVSGFSDEDISIERVGQYLYVSGNKSDKPAEVKEFYNRGLSYRAFKDSFVIPYQWKLESAEYISGVIRVRFVEERETVPVINVQVKAKQLADKAIEKAANGEKALEAA